MSCLPCTAVWRKVVGKSARDNPQRYCGWFCLPCSPKKFERMAREATDICSRVLMESSKSRLDGDSLYEQCIGHIPYYLSGLSRAHFFRQPFSKQLYLQGQTGQFTVWANGKHNSGLINFVPESRLPFVQISSIYRKTTAKV